MLYIVSCTPAQKDQFACRECKKQKAKKNKNNGVIFPQCGEFIYQIQPGSTCLTPQLILLQKTSLSLRILHIVL